MEENNNTLIKELKSKIEKLEARTGYEGRFAEIEDAYEKIKAVSFEEGVEYDAVMDYIDFLHDHAKDSKALEIAKELENIYDKDNNIKPEDKAVLWGTIGEIYDVQYSSEQCENITCVLYSCVKSLLKLIQTGLTQIWLNPIASLAFSKMITNG